MHVLSAAAEAAVAAAAVAAAGAVAAAEAVVAAGVAAKATGSGCGGSSCHVVLWMVGWAPVRKHRPGQQDDAEGWVGWGYPRKLAGWLAGG